MEILEKISRFQPHLALIDLVMPNLGGIEMIRRVRQTTFSQKLPLIAVSASTFKETQLKCMEAGCDDFLPKPVKINQLLELLEKYLKLEWIYAKNDEGHISAPKDDLKPASLEIVLPPIETMAMLHELALDGDIGDLLEQLNHLEQGNEQFQPFVAKLRQQAKQYQLDAICQFLAQHLEEPSQP